jgi:hypothetical protein
MNSLKPASASRFFRRAPACREKFHVFGTAQIIFFGDHRAVAVKENSPVHSGKLWLVLARMELNFFRSRAHLLQRNNQTKIFT